MEWTISFLHDDASYEDMTVDEAGSPPRSRG